jgi:hypothetical protein
MRCRAGFHANQAGCKGLKESNHLASSQTTPDDDLSVRIDAVNLEPVLGEIQTDGGNLHGTRLLSLWRFRRPRCGTSMPGAGAVHPIKIFARLADRLRLLS